MALNNIKFIQRRFPIIYVGIDAVKDKYDCSIINSDGEVLFKSFTISNSREGFKTLSQRTGSVSDDLTKVKVGLEAIGHYDYRLYSRSKKQCKTVPYFSTCTIDLGTVRISASVYYPSFYRNSKKVGASNYLRAMRLRKIWTGGTFAVLEREHKLNEIQKRGLQKAIEEYLLSATALNLKRLVKAV